MYHLTTGSLVKLVFTASITIQGTNAGFFRLNCDAIQHGRIDPIVSPGEVASHVHKVSGGYNFALNSTYNDMLNSKCTSCELTADKSVYWTPLLYYQHPNGTFQDVPSGGHLVYYLGRGEDIANIQPFPPGFKMVSGDPTLRSFDSKTMTYKNKRPVAERVSFACLDHSQHYKETPKLEHTRCSNGMRAQIHFQSCWDGKNAYKEDMSHVAYMSGIDNGVCPPTHPARIPNLFFEVYYQVDKVNQDNGGKFVFSNGDATGYGFHGDFMNGWDPKTLATGIKQCVVGDNPSGQISACPPLAAVQSKSYGRNCPERPPLVNEKIRGLLTTLPGCNPVTDAPSGGSKRDCKQPKPQLNAFKMSTLQDAPAMPVVGKDYNGWKYLGSAAEPKSGRLFQGATTNGDSTTPESCQKFCASKNFAYAGLEYGRECFCDSKIDAAALSPGGSTVENSIACTGNGAQFCGGPSRLMVYKKS